MTETADRRSTLCRKWRMIGEQRRPCGFDKGHEGPCSWEVTYYSDESPWRDPGPYTDVDQAMMQFSRWSAGMPVPEGQQVTTMSVLEGLLIAGVTPTEFEQAYLAAHGVDPVLSQILTGWLIRAVHGEPQPPEGCGRTGA